MSVEQVHAAQRLYIHDLMNLRNVINREMDRAQLNADPRACDDLEQAVHGMSRSRAVVINAFDEHSS